MKIKTIDWLIIGYIIISAIVILYILYMVRTEALTCLSNPIEYASNKTGLNCICPAKFNLK